MARRTRVLSWNGKDLPPELREPAPGTYVFEAIDNEAPILSPGDETGIEAALESYRQGRVVECEARSRDH